MDRLGNLKAPRWEQGETLDSKLGSYKLPDGSVVYNNPYNVGARHVNKADLLKLSAAVLKQSQDPRMRQIGQKIDENVGGITDEPASTTDTAIANEMANANPTAEETTNAIGIVSAVIGMIGTGGGLAAALGLVGHFAGPSIASFFGIGQDDSMAGIDAAVAAMGPVDVDATDAEVAAAEAEAGMAAAVAAMGETDVDDPGEEGGGGSGGSGNEGDTGEDSTGAGTD